MVMLLPKQFEQDPQHLAQQLLGKVVAVFYPTRQLWLKAQIIETEAYYLTDKASHASLGYTLKRRALFMPAGTIYMYYARGGDSLNISAQGAGNAVLIKSAIPYCQEGSETHQLMQALCPLPEGRKRAFHRQCSGQTLLCKSLGLKVKDWDASQFDPDRFYIEDVGYRPETILALPRLGIPLGRDEHLPYRFVDSTYLKATTKGR